MRRFLALIIVIALVVLAGAGYYRYYWVFGEGVKAGQLNSVMKKGFLFKTYEGKLIQAGFRSQGAGSIQSINFDFSIANQNVGEKLMLSSGKEVQLHYREYKHAIPWRGYSNVIVDSIISISDAPIR